MEEPGANNNMNLPKVGQIKRANDPNNSSSKMDPAKLVSES